ncbi:MAG: metallophosphoesterase [Acidobacteriota bacterium]|nr:metallophosphoesterase [Acidobacteriota bacterium]
MLKYLSMFLLIFGLINFYVFLRGWQVLPAKGLLRPSYAAAYWLVALAFIWGRLLEGRAPSAVTDAFTWAGSFWIAALLYLFIALVAVDALRVANHFLPFFPAAVTGNPARARQVAACAILAATATTIVCGYVNARHPRVRELEIAVDKRAGGVKSLDIAMVSDIHLGTIIGRARLAGVVDQINALEPDIVLMPGDVVDGEIGAVARAGMGEEFRRIRAKYGVFASTGNHEYIGGVDEASAYLTAHGVTMLRDEVAEVADAFSVIGREDRSKLRRDGRRKELAELAGAANRDLPVILLDHQPFDLGEAAQEGIDLQLSGHTHYGQLWPVNYVVEAIYELAWGYKRVGATHYYVSNGVGTWGPPVRVGNRPEIVHIKLRFN